MTASGDGTMKYWDLRKKSSILKFDGYADSARDISFNNQDHNIFAGAFDSGCV